MTQNFSGLLKNFRIAMLPCYPGFSPSASERTRHSVGLDLSRLGDKVTFFTRILEDKVKGRTEEDLS